MIKKIVVPVVCLFISVCFWSCEKQPLPIFGQRQVVTREENGKQVNDTVYHTIAPFTFTDQDGKTITNETFKGKVYVADFFFTSCRTICPIMKTQMLRVYQEIQNDPEVLLLSHSIDPEYDTVELLHDFAKRLDQEGLYEAVGIFPVIQTTRGFIMCGMYGHRELYALEGAGYPIHRHVPPGAKHLQYGSRFSYFFKCMPCLGGKWHSFVHEE